MNSSHRLLILTSSNNLSESSVIRRSNRRVAELFTKESMRSRGSVLALSVPLIHASLLPRWRGAAPIQQAILAGDKEIGVSIMQMAKGMDTGPYCAAAITPTLDKTYQDLIVEIGQKGAQLLVEYLEDIVNGNVVWTKQDEFCVTYANKVQKGTIDLDPNLTAAENLRRVRASSHHARCHCQLYGRQVMILATREATAQQQQSNHKSLFFECSDVPIEITKLKPSGKREMTGRAFKAGIHK